MLLNKDNNWFIMAMMADSKVQSDVLTQLELVFKRIFQRDKR
jgi:hypothetical protein